MAESFCIYDYGKTKDEISETKYLRNQIKS